MNLPSTISRVGLLGLGLGIGIALLEVGCRFYAPQAPIGLTKDILNRGRFTTPGTYNNNQREFSVTVDVNTYGFVDYEWNDTDTTDILFIGDSFVQGAQVPMDQAIGRILHNTLSQNVKSMGVPGAGTTTELLLLETWLDVLDPNVVILGFLPSNDILNNHPDLESKPDKPFIDLTIWRSNNTVSIHLNEPTVDQSGWSSHSHLLRWLIRASHTKNIATSKLDKGNGVPIDWHVYDPEIDATWTEAWSITETLFHQMNELCSSKDIALKIVLFPSIEEVSFSYQQQIQSTYPTTQTWNFQTGLETQAREILLSAGIDPQSILSLYPAFTTHQNPPSLYYKEDHHWTPLGHALASQQVKEWLESQ